MKLKTVASMITHSLILLTMTEANTQKDIIVEDTFTPCGMEEVQHYNEMTTEMLEIEVEKHSMIGDLPYELGLELIHRWTKS